MISMSSVSPLDPIVTEVENVLIILLQKLFLRAREAGELKRREVLSGKDPSQCDLSILCRTGARCSLFKGICVETTMSPLFSLTLQRMKPRCAKAPAEGTAQELFVALSACRHDQAHRGSSLRDDTPLTADERLELAQEIVHTLDVLLDGVEWVTHEEQSDLKSAKKTITDRLVDCNLSVQDHTIKCERLMQMAQYYNVVEHVSTILQDSTQLRREERAQLLMWKGIALKRYDMPSVSRCDMTMAECKEVCDEVLNDTRVDELTRARVKCTLARCVRFSNPITADEKKDVYEQVIALCDEAAPYWACEAHGISAEIHHINGEWDNCKASAKRAIEADETNANEARAWLAAALLRDKGEAEQTRQSLTEAKKHAMIVLARVERHTFARQTCVSALANLQMLPEALSECVKAINMCHRNPNLHALLARIHFDMGDMESARRAANDALHFQPNNKSALATLRKLDDGGN